MPTIETVDSMWGRVRVINGYKGWARVYVKSQGSGRSKSYYISNNFYPDLNSMMDVGGIYHFGTLADMQAALDKEAAIQADINAFNGSWD